MDECEKAEVIRVLMESGGIVEKHIVAGEKHTNLFSFEPKLMTVNPQVLNWFGCLITDEMYQSGIIVDSVIGLRTEGAMLASAVAYYLSDATAALNFPNYLSDAPLYKEASPVGISLF
ncbi:MAG: hypothetical protein Q8P25_02465 [Candidatus Curtissbacteria bacterium]|nr:hypothetical protein [Candidatus Curtissbacteria bacterium]MDZ4209654.1 hypothetical protein [Candidatus Curtissbacteria bacterium]